MIHLQEDTANLAAKLVTDARRADLEKLRAWPTAERDSFFVTLRKANAHRAVEPWQLVFMLPIVADSMKEGYTRGAEDPAVAATCALTLVNLLPLVIRWAARP